jgi:transposase InsO family protein
MATTIKEERLRWVLPIINKEIRLVDVAQVCPHGKRSLERWVAAYKAGGESSLEPKSTEPKTQPKETQIRIKERVLELRKQTKKCALKIHWQLEKEGIRLHERTIGKILRKENLVRKYRVRRVKYKYIKALRKPGDLVEIDVKYVPGRLQGRRYYQFTAIDTSSRWRHLEIYDDQSTFHSITFLEKIVSIFPWRIHAIKTDNGSMFTNRYTGTTGDMLVRRIHPLDIFCTEKNIDHYLIDPGKPSQQGTIERSHREDQEKFYDQNTFKNIGHLRDMLKEWNTYYNNLEHCGLGGRSPNEFLADYSRTNPPNVCT